MSSFEGMENNLKYKVLSREDMGWTEDEWSNFWIDMYQMSKGQCAPRPSMFQSIDQNGIISESTKPQSRTVILKKDNWGGNK